MRSISSITWYPPFSLDLTHVQPDVIYCLEISNITCGYNDTIVSDCHVFSESYNISLNSHLIYEIAVTPRSNVDGADNGTKTTFNGVSLDNVHYMFVIIIIFKFSFLFNFFQNREFCIF